MSRDSAIRIVYGEPHFTGVAQNAHKPMREGGSRNMTSKGLVSQARRANRRRLASPTLDAETRKAGQDLLTARRASESRSGASRNARLYLRRWDEQALVLVGRVERRSVASGVAARAFEDVSTAQFGGRAITLVACVDGTVDANEVIGFVTMRQPFPAEIP